MGRASPAIAGFSAGEFSPLMAGRTDLDRYPLSTVIQQNFLPLKQGPAMFRPGTCYVQPVKNSANRTWLQRFEFSQTQAYLIEFGNFYCRFYTLHGIVLTTGNAAWVNTTPYVLGNLVTYGGITYYCAVANTGVTPGIDGHWYAMTPWQDSPTTAIYEIPSPYGYADLTDSLDEFTLEIEQSGDVLYIAGGGSSTVTATGYPPYQLTHTSNAPETWTFTPYAPTDGPFNDPAPVTQTGNVALGVSNVQGYGITINAYGGNVFAATDVGRLVRIDSQWFNASPWQANTAVTAGQICTLGGHQYLALNSATTGYSGPVHTSGAVYDSIGATGVLWLYTDSGYGIAQITAYVSPTQVTANVIKRFPANCVTTQVAVTAASKALPCVLTATQTFAANAPVFVYGLGGMVQLNGTWWVNQTANGGSVTLTGLDSTSFTTYTAGGYVVQNASINWQLGAWSNTTQWPRALAFFKDRLFWGGQLQVWGSVPGLYNSHAQDFFGQVTTDAGINVTLSGSDEQNISWMKAAVILLIGTPGGEWGLDAANYSSSPLGPDNVECLPQSKWRCRAIHAELVGTTVLYVQRAGRKVQAMDYNFYLNRYDSTDQNKYAYHITVGGIIATAYQQEPLSVLWCVRADGTLLSYTYNREDQVTAWARHSMGGGGLVESIAVIPAPSGLADELWMIVNRTINGATVRTVEYMQQPYQGPTAGYAGDAQSSAWYVDCGLQSVATPAPGATTTTITGLQYLAGQTVAILADGGVQPQQVVPASGTITLAGAFTTVTVGLPYTGNLVPARTEGGADVGTAQGKLKQGSNLVLRLVDTMNGQVGQFTTSASQPPLMEAIEYNQTSTALNSPPPIFSGDVPLMFPSNAVSVQDQSDMLILVQQTSPCPMTVVALYPSYSVSERA